MISMMQPVAAVSTGRQLTQWQGGSSLKMLTKDRVQCGKRECHVYEFHVLTEPVRDIAHVCTDKEAKGCSAGSKSQLKS